MDSHIVFAWQEQDLSWTRVEHSCQNASHFSALLLTSVKRFRDVSAPRIQLAAVFTGTKLSSAGSAGTILDLFQKASVKGDEVFLSRRWEWQLTSNLSTNALALAICFLTVELEASLPGEVVQSPSVEVFKTQQDIKPWVTWLNLTADAASSRRLNYKPPYVPSNLNYSMILFLPSILNLFFYHLWLPSNQYITRFESSYLQHTTRKKLQV